MERSKRSNGRAAKSAPRRPYQLGRRAESAEATHRAILAAAAGLFMSEPYDDVSLERIATEAGVAVKTVLRRFRSKDALLLACAEVFQAREAAGRVVVPGDIVGIVRVLAKRYEAMMDLISRCIAIEQRVPAVASLLTIGRESHWAWLADSFAPMLPSRTHALHRRRVAELFTATEIYAWHACRRHHRLGRKLAEEALEETLHALVDRWRSTQRETHE